MVWDVRIPISILWPQPRGSIGEESICRTMTRVARRKAILDIVECLIVDVRFEELVDLLLKGTGRLDHCVMMVRGWKRYVVDKKRSEISQRFKCEVENILLKDPCRDSYFLTQTSDALDSISIP